MNASTPSTPSTDTQLESLKAWLLKKKPELGDIDMDFDLIENRVIDSLGFLDFVFFLEQLTGRELETDAKAVTAFRTLRNIRDMILMAGGHG
jgi:acyl carrier protein